jgi:hypothetical protein
VIEVLRKWERDIGTKAGTDKMDFKILTRSIGAREATVEANHTIESIAQLERFFDSIGKIDAHRQWGKDLEPLCRVRLRALEYIPSRLTIAAPSPIALAACRTQVLVLVRADNIVTHGDGRRIHDGCP